MESVILTSPGGNQIDYEYQLHKVSGTKGTITILGVLNQGRHMSGKCQGNLNFFQGQVIVREFCKLSGKFEFYCKCQGIVKEF